MNYLMEERVEIYKDVIKRFGRMDAFGAVLISALWHLSEEMTQTEMAKLLDMSQPHLSQKLTRVDSLVKLKTGKRIWNTDERNADFTEFGRRLAVTFESFILNLNDLFNEDVSFAPQENFDP